MYGYTNLKYKINIFQDSVECPVSGCSEKVPRQRKSFKAEKEYQCPIHKIYISPTTFEYEKDEDNLLWHDEKDLNLLTNIYKSKRESRIARDNSEDALTWNVFRYLEIQNQLNLFLSHFSNETIVNSELIYWSYSQKEKDAWSLLNKARLEFGETIARGSEPDLIVISEKTLFFIEAKLTATNETLPSNPNNLKNYTMGGNRIFEELFNSDFHTVAIKNRFYELMRFWLLGNWIAGKLNIKFNLINLTLDSRESNVLNDFGCLLRQSTERKFNRITWEVIYQFIKKDVSSASQQTLISYFENKTLGYDQNRILVKAFYL